MGTSAMKALRTYIALCAITTLTVRYVECTLYCGSDGSTIVSTNCECDASELNDIFGTSVRFLCQPNTTAGLIGDVETSALVAATCLVPPNSSNNENGVFTSMNTGTVELSGYYCSLSRAQVFDGTNAFPIIASECNGQAGELARIDSAIPDDACEQSENRLTTSYGNLPDWLRPTESTAENSDDDFPVWFLAVLVGGILCFCLVGLAIRREVSSRTLEMPAICYDNVDYYLIKQDRFKKDGKYVTKYRMPNLAPWREMKTYYSQHVTFSAEEGDIFYTLDGSMPNPKILEQKYEPGTQIPLNLFNQNATMTVRAVAYKPASLWTPKASSVVNSILVDKPIQLQVPEITRDKFPSNLIVMAAPQGDVWFTEDGSLPIVGINGRKYDPGNAYSLSLDKPAKITINAVTYMKNVPTSPERTANFSVNSTTEPEITRDPLSFEIKIKAAPLADILYSVRHGADVLKATSRFGQAKLGVNMSMRAGRTTIGAQALEEGYAPSNPVTKEFVVNKCSVPTIQTKKSRYSVREGVTEILLEADPTELSQIYFATRYKSAKGKGLQLPPLGGEPTGELFIPSTDDLPSIVPLMDDPIIVEAYCTRPGWLNSNLVAIEVLPDQKVDMPHISVVPDLDHDQLYVSLDSTTQGANIRYTIDDADIKRGGGVEYTGRFALSYEKFADNPDCRIRAIASATGMLHSDVAEISLLDFDKCATPFIRADWSERERGYIITILCATHHASLQYTFDNNNIKEEGEFYNSNERPIIRPRYGQEASVIRARATKHGLAPSEIFTLKQGVERVTPKPQISTRYISSSSGLMELTMYVPNAPFSRIFYTLDGTDASEQSLEYDAEDPPMIEPIVGQDPIQIKAFAVCDSSKPSEVVEKLQGVTRKVNSPQIDVIPFSREASDVLERRGLSGDNASIRIDCPGYPDAVIMYTTDGSDVSSSGQRYYADNRPMIAPPKAGGAPMLIQAIATLPHYIPSEVTFKSVQLLAMPQIEMVPINKDSFVVYAACATPDVQMMYVYGAESIHQNGILYDPQNPPICEAARDGHAPIDVKVIATKPDCDPSPVNCLSVETVSDPTIDIHTTGTSQTEMTLNCTTPGATIYYSVRGPVIKDLFSVDFEVHSCFVENATTEGILNAEFMVNGKWDQPQLYFHGAKSGSVKKRSFSFVSPPTKVRFSLNGKNDDAWGFWKIAANNVPLQLNPQDPSAMPTPDSKFWLSPAGGTYGTEVEIDIPPQAVALRPKIVGKIYDPKVPVSVVAPATVRVYAIKPGYFPSTVIEEEVVAMEQVATPIIKTEPLEDAGYRIQITCSTPGATIFYSSTDPRDDHSGVTMDPTDLLRFQRLNKGSEDNYLDLEEVDEQTIEQFDENKDSKISVMEFMKKKKKNRVGAHKQYLSSEPPIIYPVHGEPPIEIAAWATATGFRPSEVDNFKQACVRQAPPPIVKLLPVPESAELAFVVQASCKMKQAKIYIATDGSDVLTNGRIYNNQARPVVQAPAHGCIGARVQAYASRHGFIPSSVVAVQIPHQEKMKSLPSPTIFTESTGIPGTYLIKASCPEPGSTIYIGLNGSNAETHGIPYKDSVPLRMSVIPKRTHPLLNEKLFKLFDAVNSDRDTSLEMKEIENASKAAAVAQKKIGANALRAIFHESFGMFDLDPTTLSNVSFKKIFSTLDENHDGHVSVLEFLRGLGESGVLAEVLQGAKKKENSNVLQAIARKPGWLPSPVVVGQVDDFVNTMETRDVKERVAHAFTLNKELRSTNTTLVDQLKVERKKVVKSPTMRQKHKERQALTSDFLGGIAKQLTGKVTMVSSDEQKLSSSPEQSTVLLNPTFMVNRSSSITKKMTVAEIEQETDTDSTWEKLQPRALEAAKWTDKEIKEMITQIKKHGKKSHNSGLYEVSFGKLFAETSNVFDALSGILKTCKKYGILAYPGEQLWQGVSDRVVIVLLKEEHTGIQIERRSTAQLQKLEQGTKTAGFDKLSSVGDATCSVCGKRVYQYDRIGASGKFFHKKCFRCTTCGKTLPQNDYRVSADGNFRCAVHHREFELQNM